jgi:intergrase/recombinase
MNISQMITDRNHELFQLLVESGAQITNEIRVLARTHRDKFEEVWVKEPDHN